MSISTLSRMGFASLITIVLSVTLAGLTAAADAAPAVVKPYPLDVCVIMDDKVDPSIPSVVYKGQEFKFCCKGCVKKFNANPDKYLAKLEAEVKAQAAVNAGKK